MLLRPTLLSLLLKKKPSFGVFRFLSMEKEDQVKRTREGEVVQKSNGGDVVVDDKEKKEATETVQKKVRTHKKRRIAILYGYCGKGKWKEGV
jgi:hypothetical protein